MYCAHHQKFTFTPPKFTFARAGVLGDGSTLHNNMSLPIDTEAILVSVAEDFEPATQGNNLLSAAPTLPKLSGRSRPLATCDVPETVNLTEVPSTMPLHESTSQGHDVTPSSSGSSTSDMAVLQATVKDLAEKMAWFTSRLLEDEALEDDTISLVDEQLPSPAPVASGTSVSPSLAGPLAALADLEQFNGGTEKLGVDIDAQLAGIVGNLMRSRLSDDKLRDKMSLYVRPGNCPSLNPTRVNPEIWDKLSNATRSRDLKAHRVQSAIVQAIVAIASAGDILIGILRSGGVLSQANMAATIASLVDAMAILGHTSQDLNQQRRDDHKADLNQAFKGLAKTEVGSSTLLYGDDLTTKIKEINESNLVAHSLSAARPTATHRGASPRGRPTGRHQPYASGGGGGEAALVEPL